MRESPYTWSFGESTYGPFAHIMWSVDGASVGIVHEGNADDIDRELFGFEVSLSFPASVEIVTETRGGLEWI